MLLGLNGLQMGATVEPIWENRGNCAPRLMGLVPGQVINKDQTLKLKVSLTTSRLGSPTGLGDRLGSVVA